MSYSVWTKSPEGNSVLVAAELTEKQATRIAEHLRTAHDDNHATAEED